MIYQDIQFQNPEIRLLGRTELQEDHSLQVSWNDGGFELRFRGKGATIHFLPFQDEAPIYVRVWFDNHPQKFAVVNGSEKILLESEKEAVHTLRLIRVTEGMVSLPIQKISFSGDHPEILASPKKKPLHLLFIGDSISCGYGVCGASTNPKYDIFEEDSTQSYAYQTAELLNADITLIGASGKGIVANCEGNRSDMTLPQAFAWKNRSGGSDDHSNLHPDAVILNAGTNDAWGGVQDDEFIIEVTKFMKTIRETFPDAPIIYCYGVMDTSKNEAVRAAVRSFRRNYGNCYCLIVKSMSENTNETGGGGHPNLNTSKRVSKALSRKIKKILSEKSK